MGYSPKAPSFLPLALWPRFRMDPSDTHPPHPPTLFPLPGLCIPTNHSPCQRRGEFGKAFVPNPSPTHPHSKASMIRKTAHTPRHTASSFEALPATERPLRNGNPEEPFHRHRHRGLGRERPTPNGPFVPLRLQSKGCPIKRACEDNTTPLVIFQFLKKETWNLLFTTVGNKRTFREYFLRDMGTSVVSFLHKKKYSDLKTIFENSVR